MKKKKTMFTVFVCVFLVFVGLFVLFINQQNECTISEVEKINECYALTEEIIENGYDRTNAKNFIKITKFVLDTGINKKTFKDSNFYINDVLTFDSVPDIRGKTEGEDKVVDIITAIYLASVLSETPTEFEAIFLNYYTNLTLWVETSSEFELLLLNYFNPTEEEITIVLKSYEKLAEKCENPISKYKAYNTESYLIRVYNETTGGNLTMSSKAKESYLKVADYVKDNSDEVFIWHSYDYQEQEN